MLKKGALRNLTRGRHCPVCGHKDWCGERDDNKYGIIYVCQRNDGSRRDHIGVVEKRYGGKDGKVYQDEYTIIDGYDGRFVLTSKGDKSAGAFCSYESWLNVMQNNLQEFEQANAEYCASKGYKYESHSSLTVDGVENFDASYVYVPMKIVEWNTDPDEVTPLSHEVLDKVLRDWLGRMNLAKWHRLKLMKEWDVSEKPGVAEKFNPDTVFDSWLIKSLPPEDHVRASAAGFYNRLYDGPTRKELMNALLEICKKYGLESPKGIPGIYFDAENNEWKMLSRCGIVFPVYDADGLIYRLRIGVDFPNVRGELNGKSGEFHFYKDTWYFDRDGKSREEKSVIAWKYGVRNQLISLNSKGLPSGKTSGKYVNFSSYVEKRIEEEHLIVNKYKYGCQCGSCVSIYRPIDGAPQMVWFTEGEKKAMVIATIFKCTVVCLPGVSSYTKAFNPMEDGKKSYVQALLDQGAKMAIVAFDSDKESNEAVKRAETGLLKALWDAGFRMLNATEWHGEFGKGLDDTLLDGAMPDFRQVSF